MKNPSKDIDKYIIKFPEDVQKKLNQIRKKIIKISPKAEEKISYGIPAFFLNNKIFIYIAAFKNHISIYPFPSNVKEFENDKINYYTSGKGTIQFELKKPLPMKFIERIIKFMEKINLEKSNFKKEKLKNFTLYHKDGSIWVKGKKRGDVEEGYWEWFRKEGTIMRSGYFKNGKQIGEWTTYDKEGKVYKVTKIK